MSRSKSSKILIALVVVLSLILAALLAIAVYLYGKPSVPPVETGPAQTTAAPTTLPTTAPTTEPTTAPTTLPPTEPPIVKESTATILSTGDLLMHIQVINAAVITDGEYDFANMFRYIKDYVTDADYAVANLETTLAALDNGYEYVGYPIFNCPDGIVPSCGAAGFDMLLTANNHTNDTRSIGFFRTQQVIRESGLAHLGTIESREEKLWQVHDINGIKVGMVCYTYETSKDPDKVSLNGIPLNEETKYLIGAFYDDEKGREVFKQEMTQHIAEMKEAGAEAIVMYIHWGEEYETKERKSQARIAQMLCDLGVDVIIGGHPHVVQPVRLLTSTVDPEHSTVCIYSMGNAVSNQNRAAMQDHKSGHTEDGVLFSVTFAKYSDGTVILEGADVLPIWCNRIWSEERGRSVFPILALDTGIEDWQAAYGLSNYGLSLAWDSYNRTMDIVGEGLEEVKTFLLNRSLQTEAALGVEPQE